MLASARGEPRLKLRQFTMYGLNAHNSVVVTEVFEAVDLFEAHGHARKRVRHFHKVELWEGASCMLRMRRGI